MNIFISFHVCSVEMLLDGLIMCDFVFSCLSSNVLNIFMSQLSSQHQQKTFCQVFRERCYRWWDAAANALSRCGAGSTTDQQLRVTFLERRQRLIWFGCFSVVLWSTQKSCSGAHNPMVSHEHLQTVCDVTELLQSWFCHHKNESGFCFRCFTR